ncbi:MAG: methyl-accepting chemotaxis protein [Bacteroidota bacterium]
MNLLKNIKIRAKLTVGFSVCIFILLALSASFIYVLNQIEAQGIDLTESIKLSDNINEAKYNLTWDKQLIMEVLASETKEDVAEQMNSFNVANTAFDDNINSIKQVGSNKDWGNTFEVQKNKIVTFSEGIDVRHNSEILPLIQKLYERKNVYIDLLEKIAATSDLKVREEIQNQASLLNTELSNTDKTLDKIIDGINDNLLKTEDDIAFIVDGTSKATSELVSFSSFLTMIISLVCVVLVLLISLAITNIIAKPLRDTSAFAEKIANGDLTASLELDQKDEVGDLAVSLRKMIVKLQEVVGSVVTASGSINSASHQISESAQKLSDATSEQASSVEEISSSMEEMAANIQQTTNNSKETEKIAGLSAKNIIDGYEAVNETVSSMKTIAGKISIIGEISRQTNLLALNAAVEAARAGEHGKGFAVVAAEVRKLAERSQLAAVEIDQVSINSVDIAQKSGELLKNVVPGIQKTSELVQEIASSNMEQNSGALQINNAIQQLNAIVQENAATAEEMAAGSEELNAQAEHLNEIIKFFKTKA